MRQAQHHGLVVVPVVPVEPAGPPIEPVLPEVPPDEELEPVPAPGPAAPSRLSQALAEVPGVG